MPLSQPRTPTELEIRADVADMIEMFADHDYPRRLEAHILAKGRTEMQHVISWLLMRYLREGVRILNLEEKIRELESNNDSESVRPIQ